MATQDATTTVDAFDPEPTESESRPLQGVPWMAIALALHALLLVIAWFILPPQNPQSPSTIVVATREHVTLPPEPEQEPDVETPFPEDVIDPQPDARDEQIVPDPTDLVNSDPNDSPMQELADNESPEDSPSQSPHPSHAPNSSVGLSGGGGGPGAGGRGGFFSGRSRPPGGKPQDKRVDAALEWLKDHQNAEGYWSATTFKADSRRTDATHTHNVELLRVGDPAGDIGWEAVVDAGLTGLAMLAFTGAGYDHRDGAYRNTVRQAILYMRRIQANDGCFGPREDDHFVYNHAICAMAMAELYGISGDAMLKPVVERGVEFILRAQNPGMGWRYGVQPGENDSSVTGWMVLTLHTAYKAGLDVDYSKSFADAADYLKVMTVDVNGYPRTGYLTPGSENARLRSAQNVYDANPSMDSIYVMSMLFMDKADTRDPVVRSLARLCVEPDNLPQWKLEKLDFYYWYYASLALYQVGGNAWTAWERAMVPTLMNSQRGWHEHDKAAGLTSPEVLAEHGSWDPLDAWGSAGGRVYATAINCLTLQTYYRYQRLSE